MTENDVPSRRKRILIGSAGAAVVLAGGAAFAAAQMGSSDSESLKEPPVAAPVVTTAETPAVSLSESASAVALSSASASASAGAATPAPASTTTPAAASVKKDEAAAEDGVSAQRAPGADSAAKGAAAKGAVERRTEALGSGTVQVESARHDLSKEGLALLAAGKGESAGGGVECTSKVRFAAGADAAEKPNLLLCWRTSDSRSVVTMAVAPKGKPSTAESAEIISKEWAKLS
jgi:hypothetical protein